MRTLAKQLLIDGDMEYLAELKQLYTAKQWPIEREQLLDELKQHNSYIYAELIVQELQTTRILAYCQESANATDRKRYQDVCRSIQTMQKAGYRVEAKHLISDLLQAYAKSPAFVDELRKVQRI